ncbi:MAG: ATP-binding cassette domain-containing protein [Terracidiphilus sp.]
MGPVVEIETLTRRFGTFTAVDCLTLTANAGEVFGVLGSNGAGKSTTIKMLATLLPPSSSEARVGGFSITAQPVEVRRAIGQADDRRLRNAVWSSYVKGHAFTRIGDETAGLP